jgi:hypothetical protein
VTAVWLGVPVNVAVAKVQLEYGRGGEEIDGTVVVKRRPVKPCGGDGRRCGSGVEAFTSKAVAVSWHPSTVTEGAGM